MAALAGAAAGFHSTAYGSLAAQQEQEQQQQAQQRQQQPAQQLAQQHAAAAPAAKPPLGWQELHRAAQIAAWSGLCYQQREEDLRDRIARHHTQLTLVAQGRNEYTSWYVADGVVPHARFCETVRQRSPGPGGGAVCEVPAGTRERFLFLRGVQWSAPDVDSVKMSQALMRMWPAPFPPRQPAGGAAPPEGPPLVAHEGVAGIAQGMFGQLRPFLDQADDAGLPVVFAGHSLGGSLATLTMAMHQLQRRRSAARALPPRRCYTFGSPSVLAHEQGGHRALEALGLPRGAVKNFVLENDPVPRALLSVDPTFELLKGWGAVQGLLQLRSALAGGGGSPPLSPGRFLFEPVGEVFLVKWDQEGGSEVVPLDAHEIETELSFLTPKAPKAPPAGARQGAADGGGAGGGGGLGGIAAALGQLVSPVWGLQAWLDHHHRSYEQELEAAALRGIKQAAREQAAHEEQGQ